MPQTEAGIRQDVERSLDKNDIITFRTYYLSDYGEMVLRVIASSILERFGRSDLMDIVYSAAKELIINATKANLKRVVFTELGLDLLSPSEYEKGMHIFKERLVEDKVKEYEKVFKEMDYPVVTTFYYWPNVLNIKVKNSFMLLPEEEKKIRSKFERAHSFANLLDFYMEYGDDTEGAGLGLAMVGILLDESGIDKHAFTLYSNQYNETAARLEIPLTKDYVPRRVLFERERAKSGLSADEFRKIFQPHNLVQS